LRTSDSGVMFMARILVVEDEILIAWDLQSMLASAGFEVEIAHSVEMALRLIRSYRPDVAVLDGLLRSEAAAPVAKELESNGIPYLMCSAYNPSFFEQWANPVRFLRKPCRSDDLLSAVRLAIAQK
jgi:DNA-binding NtrC family response regulator